MAVNTENNIQIMERNIILNDNLTQVQTHVLVTEMITETKKWLGEKVGKPADWCPKMFELEKYYQLHTNKK